MRLLQGIIYFVMDILETVVFVGSIFMVMYIFLIQPNQVKGQSMAHTFEDQDYIFTSKITYKLRKPEKGDIVVFHAPKKVNQDYDVEYIKRVIGLPGDTIMFKDCSENSGEPVNCDLYINGDKQTESYIKDKSKLFSNSLYRQDEPILVPEGSLFVMGDNRPGSLDSRVFGPVKQDQIIGVVFFRYLPIGSAGWIGHPSEIK